MNIEHRRKLVAVTLFVVAVNFADLFSTWYASPDLANEWNILQRQFRLGWAGLIGAKIVGGSLAVWGYSYYLTFRENCYPSSLVDRSLFCRFLSSGRTGSWLSLQVHAPVREHFWVSLGYLWLGMQCLILWVAAENMLLTAGWVCPIRYYSEMGWHMIQSGIVAGGTLWRFFAVNFARYETMMTFESIAVVHLRPNVNEPLVQIV